MSVHKVELTAEKAQDTLSQANEELRVDVENWHEAKNKEVCQFMRQFASNHVDYHQKVHNTMPVIIDPVANAPLANLSSLCSLGFGTDGHMDAMYLGAWQPTVWPHSVWLVPMYLHIKIQWNLR